MKVSCCIPTGHAGKNDFLNFLVTIQHGASKHRVKLEI